jgi:hypothetical protein
MPTMNRCNGMYCGEHRVMMASFSTPDCFPSAEWWYNVQQPLGQVGASVVKATLDAQPPRKDPGQSKTQLPRRTVRLVLREISRAMTFPADLTWNLGAPLPEAQSTTRAMVPLQSGTVTVV